MFKTFKYRIYPNKTEKNNLLFTLNSCRLTYNKIIELRKNTYNGQGKILSRFSCNKILSSWKEEPENEFLNDIHSQVLQNVSDRVDKAYRSFFRRIKSGEKPGFPRFKGEGNYDSFTYPQSGYEIIRDSGTGNIFLKLSKIGCVKVLYHREIQGEIKTCTIKKTPTNKWFVTFSCEVPDVEKIISISNPVGIDMGLNNFITLSSGRYIPAQKFFRSDEEKLKKLNKNLSLYSKGSQESQEARKRLVLGYEKVSNRRIDFAHKVSKKLVDEYDYIVFEDLNIENMIQNHKLAKSIQDVAWNQLILFTTYKAENAGKCVKFVNPAYTSQTCSNCGQIKKKSLSERWHNCECGLSIDRDHNAAINILRLGMQSLEVPT